MTWRDWYAGINNESVAILQVVVESTPGYDPSSANDLYSRKVARFDLDGPVSRFNQELAANPIMTSWALSSALPELLSGSSDVNAIGGDLAYQYGMENTLAAISFSQAQAIISSAQFGLSTQNLQSQAALQDFTARIM